MRPEKNATLAMYKGDVAATIDFGWDGIKLDSCGAEKDLDLFEKLFNVTGKPVMIENWCVSTSRRRAFADPYGYSLVFAIQPSGPWSVLAQQDILPVEHLSVIR